MAINSQNLTAEGMGTLAENQMKTRVLDQAQQNPGESVWGAQMGQTASGQGLAPVPTVFGARTNPALTDRVPGLEGTMTGNVVTSKPAEAYIQGLSEESKTAEQRLIDQSNSFNKNPSNLNAEQRANLDYFTSKTGWKTPDHESLKGFESMLPNAAGIAFKAGEIKREFEPARTRMEEGQEDTQGTAKASEFYSGRANTEYSQIAKFRLDRDLKQQTDEFDRAESMALKTAWTSALNGQIKDAENLRAKAREIADQRVVATEKAGEDFKKTLEVEKMAKAAVGDTVKDMVNGGFEPDPKQLEYLDGRYGLPVGTSYGVYAATKVIEGRKLAKEDRDAYRDEIGIQKDLVALEDVPLNRQEKLLDIQAKLQKSKTAAYDEMDKIFSTMKNVPEGLQMKIGDASYFGIEGGAIFEKSESGDGRIAYQDANGNIQVQNIGNFGKPEDMETVYVDGMPVLRNKKTRQLAPVTVGANAAPGANVWSEMYPDGSVNPYRSSKDPVRGECAAYLNDLYSGGKVWGNTLGEKLQSAKRFEVSKDDIEVNDSIVMSTNAKWGHVALVTQVFRDPETGETMVKLNESNYRPPGGGKISNSRTMSINDPSLKAVARIPLNPEREPSNPASSLDTSVRGQGDTVNANPFIPRGVSQTESQFAASQQKWDQAQTLAADLATGGYSEKDLFQGVSADVRNAARREAASQGYKPEVPIRPLAADQIFKIETLREYVSRRNEAGELIDPVTAKSDWKKEQTYNTQLKFAISKIAGKGKNKDERQEISSRLLEIAQSGDFETLETQLTSEAIDSLPTADQTTFRAYENGIDAWGQARNVIENSKTLETGPYKALYESRKPWLKIRQDTEFAGLFNMIELGQAQVRRGFYGTAVTETEAGTAKKFLIDETDPMEIIQKKLQNGRAYLQFVNDATIAQKLGMPRPTLNDYVEAEYTK